MSLIGDASIRASFTFQLHHSLLNSLEVAVRSGWVCEFAGTRVFNLTSVCSILDAYLPHIGASGIMEAGYLHWTPFEPSRMHWYSYPGEPASVFSFSSVSVAMQYINIINHFLGKYIMDRKNPMLAAQIFIQGSYDEAVHGAFSAWGAEHASLSAEQFWRAVTSQLGLHSLNWNRSHFEHGGGIHTFSHSIGHAAFMNVAYKLIPPEATQPCYFFSGTAEPIFLLKRLPGDKARQAFSICDSAPAEIDIEACRFGIVHSLVGSVRDFCETICDLNLGGVSTTPLQCSNCSIAKRFNFTKMAFGVS